MFGQRRQHRTSTRGRLGHAIQSICDDLSDRYNQLPPHQQKAGPLQSISLGGFRVPILNLGNLGNSRGVRDEIQRRQIQSLPKKHKTAAQKAKSREKDSRAQKHISDYRTMAKEVIHLTNVERKKAGLAPLRRSERLTQAAQKHTMAQAKHGRMQHEGFTHDTSNLTKRVLKAGYHPYSMIAENVAAGQLSPKDVVNGWMHSPGHRANILNPRLRDIGIGIQPVSSSDPNNLHYSSYYWTQNFGVLF